MHRPPTTTASTKMQAASPLVPPVATPSLTRTLFVPPSESVGGVIVFHTFSSLPSLPPSLTPLPTQTAYHYGFNQDASCLALGSSRGYSIFNTHPFRPSLHESVGGVGIVEMLYCTSLLALVGAGDQAGFSPRCLKIWNTKRQASLFDVAFVSKIVAVRLNRRRLVVRFSIPPSLPPSRAPSFL